MNHYSSFVFLPSILSLMNFLVSNSYGVDEPLSSMFFPNNNVYPSAPVFTGRASHVYMMSLSILDRVFLTVLSYFTSKLTIFLTSSGPLIISRLNLVISVMPYTILFLPFHICINHTLSCFSLSC